MPAFVPAKPSTGRSGGAFIPDVASKPAGKKGSGRGVFGFLGRGASNLKDAALGTPAGIYGLGKAVGQDVGGLAHNVYHGVGLPGHAQSGAPADIGHTGRIVGATVKATGQDLRHPLRNPGYTLLDLLALASAGAGTAARVGAVGRTIGAGGRFGEIADAALTKPAVAPRILRSGEATAEGVYPKGPLARAAVKATDKATASLAERNPAGRAADRLHKGMAKIKTEELRHTTNQANALPNLLKKLGGKLGPDEQMALKITAEGVSPEARVAGHGLNIAKGIGTEAAHQGKIDLIRSAQAHLATGEHGYPVIDAAKNPRLAHAYEVLQKVSSGREDLLQKIDLLSPEVAQGRKVNAGRAAMGAEYETPTPGKLGVASPSLLKAQKRVASLEQRFTKAKGDRVSVPHPDVTEPGKMVMREVPRTPEAVDKRLKHLNTWIDKRVKVYYRDVIRADPEMRSSSISKDTRPRREMTDADRFRGVIGGGRALEPPDRVFRAQHGPTKDWNRAEQALYEMGSRPGAKPYLKAIADRMDERDELNRLKGENVPTIFREPGTEAPGYGTVSKRERVPGKTSPSDMPASVTKGGPAVHRIGGALSIAREELASIEKRAGSRVKPTGLLGHEGFAPPSHAAYVPDTELPPTRSSGRVPKVGSSGTIPKPAVEANLRHQFTGGLRAKGLERDDTTRLVADAALWANKHRTLVGLHDYAKRLATDHPLRKDDIPVRLDNAKPSERYPADVKKFLADPESMAAAPEADQARAWATVKDSLFPDQWSLDPAQRAEFARLSEEGKIGWVPRKALGRMAQQDPQLRSVIGKALDVADAVNNAQRFAILYLKPAYAIPNLLGNVALNIVQQGFAAPKNITRAVLLSHKVEPEVLAQVDHLMGEGLTHIISANQGVGSKVVEKAANFWQKGVDTPFRRAAFLHEAATRGYRTPAELTRLVTDEKLHTDLMQTTMHANREIIDYANLSPREREVVRRVIFFYPWVKGATAYAGHLLTSHPAGAGVGAQIGRQGTEQSQRDLGPVPSYLEGAFKAGGRIVNPTSAAVLQTPEQMAEVLTNALSGRFTKSGQAAGQITPALQLIQALSTHQDPFTGSQYRAGHGNAGQITRDQLVGGLPQVALLHTLFPHSSIVGKLTGPRKPSRLYRDTGTDALGRFGVGGIWPRAFNKAYLNYLAQREKQQAKTGR